jgi:hypothetical protein
MVFPLVVLRKATGVGGMGGLARGDHPGRHGAARIAVAP